MSSISNVLQGLILVVVITGFGLLYNNTTKQNHIASFNVSPDEIAKDMDGKVVQLPYGQVWPFDPTQSLNVSVVAKKQMDEYVIVLVDVVAQADVQSKDVKDKLPAKVKLGGYAKLTYESIGSRWNLVSVDSVSLRATSIDVKK